MPHTLQRGGQWRHLVGPGTGRIQPFHQPLDQPHRAAPAARRADFAVPIRGEQESADAVAPAHRRPGDGGSHLARRHGLEPGAGAEKQAGARIHGHQDRALAFFLEDLGVGPPGAGRDPPVHVADVVTGLVIPGLDEVDAAASEPGPVSPGQRRRGGLAHRQAQRVAARLQGDQFRSRQVYAVAGKTLARRGGHGTGTRSSNRSSSSSTVTPSASASYDSSTR